MYVRPSEQCFLLARRPPWFSYGRLSVSLVIMINKINKILHAPFSKEEKFEDTKGIIRIRLAYGV